MSDYSASSIRVLKGLEPVRTRPGMYTRTESPNHIVSEVLSNSVDEALAGHAKRIDVITYQDGSISVSDDGRGIPVDIHPTEKKSAVELVFTKLHAGGKFDKAVSGNAYRFSGGLHGVGVSVTNALSTRLEVEVNRNGKRFQMAFENGLVKEKLLEVGDSVDGKVGTFVRCWPDPAFFDTAKIDIKQLTHLLKSSAVLLPGLVVTLTVDDGETLMWTFTNGLSEYLQDMLQSEPVTPIIRDENFITEDNGFSVGEGASWAIAWCDDSPGRPESFVNLISTPDGGTHEAGFKNGITEAVKSFVEHHALLPRGIKLTSEDVTGKMGFILSAKVLDPQFQGQTKDKLTSRDVYKLISQMARDPMELWLNAHIDFAKKIAEIAINAASMRQKAGQKTEKRKSSSLATLPGKLTDCESTDITRNEIYIVEGDSAGGSGRQGRDKEFQAILPLRGKVINTWEIEKDNIFANTEVHDLAVAIGIDAHSIDDIGTTNFSNVRYGKVCILADADVDGAHIQALILTLFVRHFPGLIVHGHIYVANPPLFKIEVENKGKSKKIYCLDSSERDQTLEKLKSENVSQNKIMVSRFKGLGEMNPEQLWETTLCPDTRRLVQFQADIEEIKDMHSTFNLLMSKSCPGDRRAWMEKDGGLVDADI